jgi:hypothetical protein
MNKYTSLLAECNNYFINALYSELADRGLLKNISNKLSKEQSNEVKHFIASTKINYLEKVDIEKFVATPLFRRMIDSITNELSNACKGKKISFVTFPLSPPLPGYNSVLMHGDHKIAARSQYACMFAQNTRYLFFDIGIVILD